MHRRLRISVFSVWLAAAVALSADAGDWPQFRGPAGDGHVLSGPIPVSWSETENVSWKTPIAGRGHSSPVVADGLVWLTTAVTAELTEAEKAERLSEVADARDLELVGQVSLRLLAFDADSGQLVRDVELFVPDELEPIHRTNTYASPTPVIDRGRVFAHFGTYGTAAVDATSGEVLWRVDNLNVDHQNGPGSSPIVWDDLLIIHFDGTDQQFIAALQRDDGQVAWRSERSGEMNPRAEMQKAYCTPTVVQSDRGPELISPAADWVYGYDPATGEELWKAAYGELGFSTVPRPVIGHGMAFICTSFMRSRLLAVRYGGSGDVTDSHIVWTSDSQIPKKPSLILAGDELYAVNDAGILTCLQATTGEELWRERLGGNYSASPIYSDGLIYLFDEDGKTTVIRASRQFEVVAQNELGDGFTASAAVLGKALLLRDQSHLYRIEATQ